MGYYPIKIGFCLGFLKRYNKLPWLRHEDSFVLYFYIYNIFWKQRSEVALQGAANGRAVPKSECFARLDGLDMKYMRQSNST
jgi:hypothetical protein